MSLVGMTSAHTFFRTRLLVRGFPSAPNTTYGREALPPIAFRLEHEILIL